MGSDPAPCPNMGPVSFRLSHWGSGSLVPYIWRYFPSLPYSYNPGSLQEVIPSASSLKPFSRDPLCHMPVVGNPASRANFMLDPTGTSSVSYAGDHSHSKHPHITLGHHFRTPQQLSLSLEQPRHHISPTSIGKLKEKTHQLQSQPFTKHSTTQQPWNTINPETGGTHAPILPCSSITAPLRALLCPSLSTQMKAPQPV